MITKIDYTHNFSGMHPKQLKKFVPELSDDGVKIISDEITRLIPDLEIYSNSSVDDIDVFCKDFEFLMAMSFRYEGDNTKNDKLKFLINIINSITSGM